MYDDFFKIECEKEKTCEVVVINLGDFPMFVDVTYTDSIPNQKRLIYPGENFTYTMKFGPLVTWAKLEWECGWTAHGIYVPMCGEYEMKWETVYSNKSEKIIGKVDWSSITSKPKFNLQH
jgi:hypothetical protein